MKLAYYNIFKKWIHTETVEPKEEDLSIEQVYKQELEAMKRFSDAVRRVLEEKFL